ncbi:outer membrane beta-barrel protein [Terrimonas alba]|uniref:outer membrane beta-barrel protein n=1 Tax=Terrimonas alba TaxID=3349636 RepID=UPI0035F30F3C
MRKTLLSLIVASLFVLTAQAQIKRGSIFLGGDVSGYTYKTEWENAIDQKSKGLNISPVFGKFIKDNLVVGGSLSYSVSNTENDPGTENKAHGYGAGVFIRKYKNIGSSGFYLFIQGGLNGGYSKQKTDDPFTTSEIKRTTIGINANPGISYAVGKKFHLETGFNNLIAASYSHEKGESNSNSNNVDYKSNGFSVYSSLSNATSSLYLGFRLLIGK